ncbi:MAG TPA: hypothetical protein ENK18_26180 [Deltaproteobacteria bacterium]|nr:hypothetical protein [Deltaproteobacteria bacterium]
MFWIGLLWGVALAGDALTFDAVTTVVVGQGQPSLTLHPWVEGTVRVSLVCAGRPIEREQGVAPGTDVVLPIVGLPEGKHPCTGTVRLEQPDGAWAQVPLSFEVRLLQPLSWRWSASDLELEAGTLVVHPSRPVTEARLEVVGLGGATVASAVADLTDPSHPTFSWQTPEEVLQLVVTGTDGAGTEGRLELSPWSYAIPHDDVVFDSGSAVIQAAEVGKLEACWGEVQRVIAGYGDVVDIELFVAGFTDTVGPAEANMALSRLRARTIAGWFRDRGFTGAIWFQGRGESGLAVATADEVDEVRNRRALYLLAAEPPISELLPSSAWKSLR